MLPGIYFWLYAHKAHKDDAVLLWLGNKDWSTSLAKWQKAHLYHWCCRSWIGQGCVHFPIQVHLYAADLKVHYWRCRGLAPNPYSWAVSLLKAWEVMAEDETRTALLYIRHNLLKVFFKKKHILSFIIGKMVLHLFNILFLCLRKVNQSTSIKDASIFLFLGWNQTEMHSAFSYTHMTQARDVTEQNDSHFLLFLWIWEKYFLFQTMLLFLYRWLL